jgi:hypothetical protein
VGVLEWLGAHLLAPVSNAVRAYLLRPRPDVQIVELVPTGGDSDYVDFRMVVENRGNKQIRATVAATVSGTPVLCQPDAVNLLYNTEPTAIRILVPHEKLGDLVPEFNGETTLYGATLTVEVVAGKKRLTETWTETIYTLEENAERHDMQQKVWRRGRGQETPRERLTDEAREAYERKQDEGNRPDPSAYMG